MLIHRPEKAFHTVKHTILLDKHQLCGLRGPIFNLLKSYLANRIQSVYIETKNKSSRNKVWCPTTILNDIGKKSNNPQQVSNVLPYPYDTVIQTTSSLNSLKADPQKVLNETNVWLASNKLTLNREKKLCFSAKVSSETFYRYKN